MKKKTSSRVVLNRQKLEGTLPLGLADGVDAFCREVLGNANPPDAPPYGQGLVDAGGYLVMVKGRKVSGDASKPRAFRAKGSVTAAVGYGFPGRFVETGTNDTRAQPFLSPAVAAAVPSLQGHIVDAVRGLR